MSHVFHKSCYTSRSSGYKYRTLSTNTGDRKRRSSTEENNMDKVFKDLRQEISSRIFQEFNESQRTREHINDKFEKIEAKIDSMLELQDNVKAMRKSLQTAENALIDIVDKVAKIELFTSASETYGLHSKKSSFRSRAPVFEEEIMSSTLTHV